MRKKLKYILPALFTFLLIGGVFWIRSGENVKYEISADTPSATGTTATCGLDIALVVDKSGSIDATEMTQMKTALKSFVDSFLPSTLTEFSVTQFDTTATVDQAFTSDATLIKSKIDAIPSPGGGNTNWEDAFLEANSTFDPRANKPNMIIFASDGNPTAANTIGTLARGHGAGATTTTANALAQGVTQANLIKAKGTKIMGIMIGTDASLINFEQITGPNVSPTPVPIGYTTDVITSDFSTLSASLGALYTDMCANKISVQSTLDTNSDGVAELNGTTNDALLSNYKYTLTSAASGSSPTSLTSDMTGSVQFSGATTGTYSISGTPATADYTLSSASCTIGGVSVGTVDVSGNTITGIPMTLGDSALCTFMYKNQPLVAKISLALVANPTSLPIGGGTTTYTYTVTNPSLAVLDTVQVVDDTCAPVVYKSGDTNGDSKLQNSETWTYQCSHSSTSSVTNHATVTANYNSNPVSATGSSSVTQAVADTTTTITPAGPPATGRND